MATLNSSRFALIILISLCFVGPLPARATEGDPEGDAPLTRREFAKFLKEYRQFQGEYGQLKQENTELRKELAELKNSVDNAPSMSPADMQAQFDVLVSQQREVIIEDVREELRDITDPLLPGMTSFALGGAAVASYQDRDEADSTFGVAVAPILLWKPYEKVLFETQIAFGLSGNESWVDLDQFQISYLLNDYMTVGAGKFLTPFGTFWERWHPAWINKLATMPLMYERGLVGPTGLGVQLRGGFALGKTKLNYATYYINGPDYEADSFASAGKLGFSNYTDNNNGKSFGGRVGFLPIPELELGYSFMTGTVGDSNSRFKGIETFIQGVDLSYAREFQAIKGRVDLRAEAIWVDTDRAIFTGPFDPFTFDNNRDGWFVQGAYRPTLLDVTIGDSFELKNLEFIVRYDQLRESGPARRGADQTQLTLGVDYWIRPNVVWKLAYSRTKADGDSDSDGLFMQFALGF